jgi:hypothetical protein
MELLAVVIQTVAIIRTLIAATALTLLGFLIALIATVLIMSIALRVMVTAVSIVIMDII